MNYGEKFALQLKEVAADFFLHETTPQSLITVTSVTLSRDGRRATVLCTVLPDTEEANALSFLRRRRSDLYAFALEKLQKHRMPLFDIAIDRGEKSRQGLDKALYDDRLKREKE
ncbi:MAG: hypothetical protein COV10_01590 [Candidatus Vogelbacteria bacterium CG10_big_fil_rev_8_21_14_0_10_51_16]|uniref:Ribosome-binding factor A n=1 Tax=Candidatus Vogelbacteria bacterium CG10_big_fil_rev_8_21_14_0_10_51_16 TaxID=1975045 RepID=A0A2H0REZ1_9BACT|nr:MAG: hypothetical protein COV10_01590 [Candidatus Vogelbacteria bacterium CG10_big_fil_rev_8_21_14_0_10_51_16]